MVAVVLFKLARLVQTIEDGRDVLRNLPLDVATTWSVLRDKGFEALSETVKPESGIDFGINRTTRRDLEAAHLAHREWGGINWRLYLALWFSVGDILLCFGALPLTPRIARSDLATRAVLLSAVGLGITSLAFYVWLIAAIVRRQE